MVRSSVKGWAAAWSKPALGALTGAIARPAVADAETARNLAASRSTAPHLRVLSLTPRELPIRRLVIGAAVLD